jgi:hypothetical protein
MVVNNYWIYINGRIVDAPPHGTTSPARRDFNALPLNSGDGPTEWAIKLAALASRWSERLHEQTAQGFSFSLCLSERPFVEGPFLYPIDVMGDE